MSTVAHAGPIIGFGQAVQAGAGLGQSSDPNPSRSPSMFDQGCAIMDPRTPFCYQPGASFGGPLIGDRGAYGWWGQGRMEICNQVPSATTTTAISAAAIPVANTPLSLVATSGSGITVGTSITRADTGVQVNGLLAIDGAMTARQNGATGGNLIWNATTAVARAVAIHSVGNDSGATFTVRGYDVYGYPMTETITGATAGNTATGNKAFKYIVSITPAGTLSGSNVSAGQSDTIGFMLRSDRYQFMQIWWPDTTLIGSATGFTAADTTTATAITGDVRGTYALQGAASDGTRRLIMFDQISIGNMGSAAGLVGVPQFADF